MYRSRYHLWQYIPVLYIPYINIWHDFLIHIPVIYQTYTIWERYISGICLVYIGHMYFTLVLRWWARPHTAWTTGNNVPGPGHDAYFFYIGATAAFGLAHVAVDSGQHLLGQGPWPDSEQAWHSLKKSTEGRRIHSFYRPCPLFKHQRHQRHWLNANGTFRFFKFEF